MAQPDMHPISFTYAPVASMWGVTLHNLFLYSDLPLSCHPPSYWLRLFLSQTFYRTHTKTFLKPSHSTPTCLWRWNRQSVLKRRRTKFRCRGITQKKAYNLQNMAKVWNQEVCFSYCFCLSPSSPWISFWCKRVKLKGKSITALQGKLVWYINQNVQSCYWLNTKFHIIWKFCIHL